jgi:hypothetical protein
VKLAETDGGAEPVEDGVGDGLPDGVSDGVRVGVGDGVLADAVLGVGVGVAAVEEAPRTGEVTLGRRGVDDDGAGVVTTPMIVCRSAGLGAGRTSRYTASTTTKATVSAAVDRRTRSANAGREITRYHWAGRTPDRHAR